MKLSHLAYRIARRLCVLEICQLSLLELTASDPVAARTGTDSRDQSRAGDSPAQAAAGPEKFDISWLTAEQLLAASRQTESGLEADLAEPLRSGRYRCLAAWDQTDRQLAGYLFLAWGGIEPEHNWGWRGEAGFGISLPPQHAFLFKAFVVPQFRGLGLYRAMLEQLKSTLRLAGTEGVLATTEWINTPALRSIRQAGFHSLGLCWRFGIGSSVWGYYPKAGERLGMLCDPAPELLSRRLRPAPPLPRPELPARQLPPQEPPTEQRAASAAPVAIDPARPHQASLESPAICG